MHRELSNTRCPGKNITNSIIENLQKDPYDTYTIKQGDTLWSISSIHNLTVNELKDMNNLTSNTIYPNQIIRVF